MSDSNWLYSTLAQSTAAMVAVGVAFFVPRLQEHRREAQGRAQQMRGRVLGFVDERNRAAANASKAAAAAGRAIQELEVGRSTISPANAGAVNFDNGVWQGGGRQPTTPSQKDIGRITDLRVRAADYAAALECESRDLINRMARSKGHKVVPAWLAAEHPPADPGSDLAYKYGSNPSYWEVLEFQEAWIRHTWHYRDERALAALEIAYKSFRRTLILSRLSIPFGLVCGLLVVGLLVPLTYLSAEPGHSKLLLLVGFDALSVALMGFFGRVILEIRALAWLPDLDAN